MLRPTALAVLIAAALALPTQAQDLSFPSADFPEPGTFCGPLTLCTPEVTTRDATQ